MLSITQPSCCSPDGGHPVLRTRATDAFDADGPADPLPGWDGDPGEVQRHKSPLGIADSCLPAATVVVAHFGRDKIVSPIRIPYKDRLNGTCEALATIRRRRR